MIAFRENTQHEDMRPECQILLLIIISCGDGNVLMSKETVAFHADGCASGLLVFS